MARRRNRISIAERQKDADPNRASAGTGFPKVPSTCRLIVELCTLQRKESKNPKTPRHELVIAEFKVLEVLEESQEESDGKVKEGGLYSTKMDLDKEFNEGNSPDADRLAQLAEAICKSLEYDVGDDGPSVDDVYGALDDEDIEAFEGTVLETQAFRKKTEEGYKYTLHLWSAPQREE